MIMRSTQSIVNPSIDLPVSLHANNTLRKLSKIIINYSYEKRSKSIRDDLKNFKKEKEMKVELNSSRVELTIYRHNVKCNNSRYRLLQ